MTKLAGQEGAPRGGAAPAGPSFGPQTQGVSFKVLAEISVGATARIDLCRAEGPNRPGMEGQMLAVKRLHQKIANIRKDAQHKATSAIVKMADTIVVESLNVKGMMKAKLQSKAIAEECIVIVFARATNANLGTAACETGYVVRRQFQHHRSLAWTKADHGG